MAVRIRMKRMGRTHRPFYRVCVMDVRSPRDGKAIEEVGYYDPMVQNKADRVSLKMERVEYWLSVGAQPSDKVATLIKKVKNNKFGQAAAPPPMMVPKPEPEVVAEEVATEETTADASEAEASAEETLAAAEEAKAEASE